MPRTAGRCHICRQQSCWHNPSQRARDNSQMSQQLTVQHMPSPDDRQHDAKQLMRRR